MKRGTVAGALGVLLAITLTGCMGATTETPVSGSSTDTTTAPPAATPAPGAEENATANATLAPGPVVQIMVKTTGTYPIDPAFAPASISAPAGATIELTFENADLVPVIQHDWVLEGVEGAKTKVISPGEKDTITFTLPTIAGEFKFYCSVGDHRERGMEGTFTVTAA